MLVLPKDGQGLDAARQEMLQEIDDPLTIVLVARGADEDTREFVDRAEKVVRLRRRVVYLRAPEILTAEEEESWFADEGENPVIGAVLNDRAGRCGRVLQRRQSRINIDRAFLACEKLKGAD